MTMNMITAIAYEIYHDGLISVEQAMEMYGMTMEDAETAIAIAEQLNQAER